MSPAIMKSELQRILGAYILCIGKRSMPQVLTHLWSTFIALLVASKGVPPLPSAIKVLVTSYSMTLSVFLLNDIIDFEVDRINELDRPIAQGKVSRGEAMSLVILLSIVSIILSLSLNLGAFLLCVIFLALGLTYSAPHIYLKGRSFMSKPLISATGIAITSLIGGAALGSLSPQVLFTGFLFFVTLFGATPLMDLKDIKGDRESGYKTLALIRGPSFVIGSAIMTFASLAVITLLGYPHLGFNVLTPMLITVSVLAIAWLIFSLRNRWQEPIYFQKTIRRIMVTNLLLYFSLFIGVF